MKKKTRSVVIVSAMVLLGLALVSCASAPLSTSEKEQKQEDVRNVANTTLAQLYAKHPAAKSEIA
jgi:ABC-type oligopeptide transport system substrate-binding subunit